jgi:drug/metabolite transporter (DMT)-like permease
MKDQRQAWMRWMLLAFIANGLGPFGLKIIAERGLAESYRFQYLIAWYGGGLSLMLVALLMAREAPGKWELLLGAMMGLGSFGGQLFSSLALQRSVPGYVVFPATTGGSLFVVPLIGVLLFREKISRYGIAGIVTGTAALLLLSVS